MDQKIEEIKGNGYQLLSVSDEELRDASLQRQVFNNINETSNCVSFNYDLVKPYTEPTNCVTFNKNLIGKYSLNVV
jgi:hypothetical protein